MPVTQVKTPSGEMISVNHPEGATSESILRFAAASQGVKPQASVAPDPARDLLSPSGSAEPSAFDRFMFEFSKAPTITGNLALMAEAAMPMGYFNVGGKYGFYASPTEIFGEGYDDLSYDQRRERLVEFRKEVEQIKYPELSKRADNGESTGIAGVAGAFIGALADPTTLAPVGRGLASVAGISGALGGAYEATRGLAEEGKIDLGATALTAGGGAVLGAGLSAAVTRAAPVANRLKASLNAKKTALSSASANRDVDALNNKILELKAEGFADDNNVVLAAAEQLDMTPKRAAAAIEKGTSKIEVPEQEVATALQEYQNAIKANSYVGLAADLMQPISDRIGKISQPILRATRGYELSLLQRSKNYSDRIQGFDAIEKALPDQGKEEFFEALLNMETNPLAPKQVLKKYDIQEVKLDLLGRNKKSAEQILDDADSLLKEIGEEWSALTNGEASIRPNFFPRENIDVQGTRRSLGLTNDTELDKMLEAKAKSMKLSGRGELPEAEASKVLDDYLSGVVYNKNGQRVNVRRFKQRRIDTVSRSKNMLKYYRKPSQTLSAYVHEMADNIETARFLKNNKAHITSLGATNTKESIGKLTSSLLAKNEITSSQAEDLRQLLEARLVAGKTSMSDAAQIFRNLTNAMLLGNIRSATTQIGDLFVGAYRYGSKNALNGMLKTVTGRSDIDVDDLGIIQTISSEMSGAGKTAKFLDTMLAASFFKRIDRFGKNSSIQAAFERNSRLAGSEKGVAQIKEKWGQYFGDDFDSLIRDLTSKNPSSLVKELAFAEISGIQPVSLLETPKKYLTSKDGKLFWMLKTYALRQLAAVKNDTIDEFNKGNKIKAGKNFLAYMAIVGAGNATVKEVKNWEDGKGFDPNRVPDQFIDSMFNLLLTSRYAVENARKEGDYIGIAVEAASPPLSVFRNMAQDMVKTSNALLEGEEVDKKWMRNIPFAGRAMYNLFGGGAEAFLEREARD